MNISPNKKHYFIWGMGLLGTSLAIDLKQKGHAISGCVLKEEEQHFLVQNLQFDKQNIHLLHELPLEKILQDIDAMIITTPVNHVFNILKEVSKYSFKEHFWITDVSSSKKELIEAINQIKLKVPFVASHPMAGSDKTGCFNAHEHLFHQKTIYIVLSTEIKQLYGSKQYHIYETQIKSFWQSVGALPYSILSEMHDKWAAYLSHGPHLISCFTSLILENIPEVLNMPQNPAGGSFRDITRVSGSNPQLWNSIISTNKKETMNYLKTLSHMINQFISDYEQGIVTIEDTFEKAQKIRETILCID